MRAENTRPIFLWNTIIKKVGFDSRVMLYIEKIVVVNYQHLSLYIENNIIIISLSLVLIRPGTTYVIGPNYHAVQE